MRLLNAFWELSTDPRFWLLVVLSCLLFVVLASLFKPAPRIGGARRWRRVRIALLAALLIPALGGCTTVTYQSAEGSRVSLSRFGYDTKLGELAAGKRADGSVYVNVKNLDSDARAIDLAERAVDVAGAAAAAAKGGLP